MSLADVLLQLREYYLEHLRSGIVEARRQHPTGQAEVLLEIGQGRLSRPYSLYRVDFLAGTPEDPKLSDFNRDSHLNFSPLEFEADSLRGVLHPLYWNGVEFRAVGSPAAWAPLESWIAREIDVEDRKIAGGDGLASVIHNATQPALDGDHWTFSVDFGSASVDSFFELVDLLRGLGIRQLGIGSFSMID